MNTNSTSSSRAPRRTRVNGAAREAVNTPQDNPKMSALNKFLAAQEEMLREWGAPSGKRAMVAFGTALVVSFGIGYIGGVIIEAMTITALALTGSAFVGLMIWVLGLVATIVVAAHAAPSVYGYIASKHIDAHIEKAKGWFTETRDTVATWFNTTSHQVH